MIDFLSKLFDTADFPARWSCGRWSQGHGWLHILSDLGVFGAYLGLESNLVWQGRNERDGVDEPDSGGTSWFAAGDPRPGDRRG